ncbi:OB-fold protein [Lelliottia aquatilis]|uniref:OB-fold protein n=1 Tax=Lelliottia aquatilis TaxID=2080838 RepID=UPI0013FD7DCA|nr:hypothetical protein [Lelliottia aquatilis]
MRKVFRWLISFALIVIALSYFLGDGKDGKTVAPVESSSESATPAPVKSVTHAKAVFTTSALSLYEAYNQNEVLADENMKGKLIRVTGVVSSIDKDFADDIVINLFAGDEYTTAGMGMNDSEKSKVMKLRKGQHVTVTCERMMRVMDLPSGSDCVLN